MDERTVRVERGTVLGRFDHGRLVRRRVFALPGAEVAVEQVEPVAGVAVEFGGDQQPRGEHAVGVVVGDEVVVGRDPRLAHQRREHVGPGEHPRLALLLRAEGVERDVHRTGEVADTVVLPRLADVDDADVGGVEPVGDPGGRNHDVVHTPWSGRRGFKPRGGGGRGPARG